MLKNRNRNNFLLHILAITAIWASMLPISLAYPKLNPEREQFINRLVLQVKKENQLVYNQRAYLLTLRKKVQQNQPIDTKQQAWLRAVAKLYRVKSFQIHSSRSWQELLNRANIIPTSMVIAQAINESSWGQSRFAKQGNTLFGMWCFKPGCGIVPLHRQPGQRFEVKAYRSTQLSIQDYFLTLNRTRAYRVFRQERAKLVQKKQGVTGLKLIQHLRHYSEKGMTYTQMISRIIRHYRLNRFDAPNRSHA